MLATVLVGSVGLTSVPFFLAGGLNIVYDLLLYRSFANSEAEKKYDGRRSHSESGTE
jgi:hypothetical protein